MIFFLGIIFLLLIVFFLDWLSSKNRNELNKKINLIIIFISFGIGIFLLVGGLYLYSPLFLTVSKTVFFSFTIFKNPFSASAFSQTEMIN